MRFITFFILFFAIGCSEKKIPEEQIVENSQGNPLSDLKKQRVEFHLNLSYDSTELIGEEIVLNFTFSVRNNTNDTIRLLANNCPSFDPFKIDGTLFLNFYETEKDICYTKSMIYKIFNPKSTVRYVLKLKLLNKNQSLTRQKIRIGFKGYFGAEGQTPYELLEMYTHIDMSSDFPTYWSNYISLKDDYKQVKDLVK